MAENVPARVLKWNWKPWLKAVHIALIAASFGGILAMIVILLLKNTLRPGDASVTLDLGLYRIFNYAVTWSFFGLIGTSVIYGLFTEWGFLKFWWVLAKWLSLAALFVIAWTALGPAVNGLASLSDAGYHVGSERSLYLALQGGALFWSVVTGVLMLFALFVSVVKPWGPTNFKLPYNRVAVLSVVLGLAGAGIVFGVVGSLMQDSVRNMPIRDSKLKGIRSGVYRGTATVAGFRYVTEVTIRRGRIVTVKAVKNRKSPYAYYAEGVFRKIVRDQNANTDVITGASTTSKALMKSVENAIAKARKK